MELHRFFRYAIEKMCKEKKSLNHFIIFEYLVLPVEKINFAIEDKTIFIVGTFCFAFSIFLYFHSEKTSSVFYLMYIIVTPGIWLMQFFFQRIISIKNQATATKSQRIEYFD